jgi:hypothetical protein
MSDQERAAHEEPAPRRRTPTYVVGAMVIVAVGLLVSAFTTKRVLL